MPSCSFIDTSNPITPDDGSPLRAAQNLPLSQIASSSQNYLYIQWYKGQYIEARDGELGLTRACS